MGWDGMWDLLDEVLEMLDGIDVLFLLLGVIWCGRRLFRELGGCAECQLELKRGTYVSESTSGIAIVYDAQPNRQSLYQELA